MDDRSKIDCSCSFFYKFGHARAEWAHANPLLHRFFYKMEAESVEKDTAMDRIKQTQSGAVDGSQLGSLMDAFSGRTNIDVNFSSAFNKNTSSLKSLKVKIAKLHEEGLEISSTLMSLSEKMYSAICKENR